MYASEVLITVFVNKLPVTVLAGTSRIKNFINVVCAKNLGLKLLLAKGVVKLPDASKISEILGTAVTSLTLDNQMISNVHLFALVMLAADIIIGTVLHKKFISVAFHFG